MSKTRKEDSTRRRDIRIPLELDEKIQQIAREKFEARIHHISKEPEVTDTVVKLIEIGIRYLDAGLSDMVADKLPDTVVSREEFEREIAQLRSLVEAK